MIGNHAYDHVRVQLKVVVVGHTVCDTHVPSLSLRRLDRKVLEFTEIVNRTRLGS